MQWEYWCEKEGETFYSLIVFTPNLFFKWLSHWKRACLLIEQFFFTSAQSPPSFTDSLSTSPSDSVGVVAEGKTVTFNCKADGSDKYTYSYIATDLKGVSRNLGSDSRYTIHQDGRLVITNAQHAKDDGYYFCKAKNKYGTALSKRAKLHVACKSLNISLVTFCLWYVCQTSNWVIIIASNLFGLYLQYISNWVIISIN